MNTLLIYFAFPIATIIVSIILQKLLHCPRLVAAFIFAVFLIVTFTAFDDDFLIATFAYTILSLITALITRFFCSCANTIDTNCLCNNADDTTSNNNDNSNCNCNRYYMRRRF